MDSLTQLALGAAVGEAVLGKQEGNKAMLWGAIAGTVPDLDILIYPFVNEVQELAIHRGLSHSIFFAVVASPPLGLLLSRIYKRSASWKKWSLLFFWAFFTHALLDCFTSYGTQIFYPFTNLPVGFDTIFIVDPLYTLPLLTGVVLALYTGRKHPHNSTRRTLANQIGLLVSSLYLVFTLCNKLYITDVFEDALAQQNISYAQLFSNPSPFNNVLWYAVADDGVHLWIGTYSWFDPDRNVGFHKIPKNADLIAPYLDQLPVERLLWFSRGYFVVEERAGGLYFNDVRFPRSDFYLDEDGEYLFSFRLLRDPTRPDILTGFTQDIDPTGTPEGIFGRLVDRLLGNPSA